MPLYLKPRSGKSAAIAICGRCGFKHPYSELSEDPNIPGLRVCDGCKDVKDPYTLPRRGPEKETLEYPRPDLPLE